MVSSLTEILEELKDAFTPTVAKAEVCLTSNIR